MKLTINEGLDTLKSLNARHAELVSLRQANALQEHRHYGVQTSPNVVKEFTPMYDVKALDKLITTVAKEIRQLTLAIRRANVITILDYEWDESKYGEVA